MPPHSPYDESSARTSIPYDRRPVIGLVRRVGRGFIEPDGELGLGDLVVLLRSLEGSVELRPPPPTLDADPATTDNPLPVTGTASPNATIHLYVNGEEQYISGQADPDGTFSLPAILFDGSNTLCAVAETSFGVSDPSACTAVTYTNDVPRDLCNGQTWYDVGLVGAPEVVVWTPGGGPYEVEAPCSGIRVNEASTLILQPGAELAAVPPDGGGPIDPFNINVYDGATLVIRQGVTIKVLESLWVTGINPADPKGGGLIDIQISEDDERAVTLEFQKADPTLVLGRLLVSGTLRAGGTANASVLFTVDSQDPDPNAKWAGVHVTPCGIDDTECHSVDLELDHVTISSAMQPVWRASDGDKLGEIHIANTTIGPCGYNCVELDRDAEGGIVIENSTIDCVDGSFGVFLSSQTTTPSSIVSNTIKDCGTGIYVTDGSVDILANYVAANGYGIRLGLGEKWSSSSTVTALVSGNYIHDNTSCGIKLYGSPASSVIIDDSVASGGPPEADGHNNFIVGSNVGVAVGQIDSYGYYPYQGSLTIRGQTIGGKPFPDGDPGGDPVYTSYPAIQVQAAYWPAPPVPPLILIENNDIRYAAKGIEVKGSVVEIIENGIHHNQGAGVDFAIPAQNLYPEGASILTRNDIHHNQEGVRVEFVEAEVRLDGYNLIHDHTGPGVHMFTDSYASPSLVLNHTVFYNNSTGSGGNPDLVIEGFEPATAPIVDARWNWWGGDGSIGEVEDSFSIAQGSAAAIDYSYFITFYDPLDPYFDQTPPAYDPDMHATRWIVDVGIGADREQGAAFAPAMYGTTETEMPIWFTPLVDGTATVEIYNERVYHDAARAQYTSDEWKACLGDAPDVTVPAPPTPVATLSPVPVVAHQETSVLWDGKDAGGDYVPDDAYAVRILLDDGSSTAIYNPAGCRWPGGDNAAFDVISDYHFYVRQSFNTYRNDVWKGSFEMRQTGRVRGALMRDLGDGNYQFEGIFVDDVVMPPNAMTEARTTIYWDGRDAGGAIFDGPIVPVVLAAKELTETRPLFTPYVHVRGGAPVLSGVPRDRIAEEDWCRNISDANPCNAELPPVSYPQVTADPYLIYHSYDQVVNIGYCVDQDATVTVKILKGDPAAAEPLVATLVNQAPVAASDCAVSRNYAQWNGLPDGTGALPLLDRLYTFEIEAANRNLPSNPDFKTVYRGVIQTQR